MEAVQDKVDKLADKDANSTESEVRYLAYGARLRTALRAGQRYIAYVCFYHPYACFLFTYQQTSDVGEAFRPVVPPWVVTAAYGISWIYLAG